MVENLLIPLRFLSSPHEIGGSSYGKDDRHRLGTTNSAWQCWRAQPTVIPNAEGGRTTPSVVAHERRRAARRPAAAEHDLLDWRFMGRVPEVLRR
jgi:hypothetical protein